MYHVVESDFCARHRVRLVWVKMEPPVRVCPICKGGKSLLEFYGSKRV